MFHKLERPGYFGRARDRKVADLNSKYGEGNWNLAWVILLDSPEGWEYRYDFLEACKFLYEESYFRYLRDKKDKLDFICSFGECIDNAPTNVQSGLDYSKQESFSTHIQDIAVRNVISRLGRRFEGPPDNILVIRSTDSNGFEFGPGNIPFAWPSLITKPYLTPKWANDLSVESFWQSNKWLMVKK